MVFFLKPVQWVAQIITIISLAFFISAIVTSSWIQTDYVGSNYQYGIFRACGHTYGGGAGGGGDMQECRYITNNCNVDFSTGSTDWGSGGRVYPNDNCNKVRAVRALAVIAAALTALSIVPMLVTACVFEDLPLRVTAFLLLILATACGAIAMGIFTTFSFATSRWEYGSSFALFGTAWVLSFVAAVLTLFPHRIHAPAVVESKDVALINPVVQHRSSISAHRSAPVTQTIVADSDPVIIHQGPDVPITHTGAQSVQVV